MVLESRQLYQTSYFGDFLIFVVKFGTTGNCSYVYMNGKYMSFVARCVLVK